MKHFIHIAVCFALSILVLSLLSHEPLSVFWVALSNSLTGYGLGQTLFYTTFFLFLGTGVALGNRAGFFNVGAEGQMYMGAMALVYFSPLLVNLPWQLALPICFAVCILFGGLWALVAGMLREKFNIHEVISTILLNFVATKFSTYFILQVAPNPQVQNPESMSVNSNVILSQLGEPLGWNISYFYSTPLNTSIFLALILTLIFWKLFSRHQLGHHILAVGSNPRASHLVGINVKAMSRTGIFLSGAMCGLAAVNEVLGHEHRLLDGFSPGYGFMAIAVALVAKNRFLVILVSALFFGILQNSAKEIELASNHLTKDAAFVLQAVAILVVSWNRKKNP